MTNSAKSIMLSWSKLNNHTALNEEMLAAGASEESPGEGPSLLGDLSLCSQVATSERVLPFFFFF